MTEMAETVLRNADKVGERLGYSHRAQAPNLPTTTGESREPADRRTVTINKIKLHRDGKKNYGLQDG